MAGRGGATPTRGRALRATPAFTIVALAVPTLSIGATTAIFSVVDAVVLRALPFGDGDRLVAVGELDGGSPPTTDLHEVAPQNFLDWRAQQRCSPGWRPSAMPASA